MVVLYQGPGKISVFDLRAGTHEVLFDQCEYWGGRIRGVGGGGTAGYAISDRGELGEIWSDSDRISCTAKERWFRDVAGGLTALSRDESRIGYVNQRGQLVIQESDDDMIIALDSDVWVNGPRPVWIGGESLLYYSWSSGTNRKVETRIYEMDSRTSRKLGNGIIRCSVDRKSDGTVYCGTEAGDVFQLVNGVLQIAKVIFSTGISSEPCWSPSGEWLLYTRPDARQLFEPAPIIHVLRVKDLREFPIMIGYVENCGWLSE
jgi:hypothetical protein